MRVNNKQRVILSFTLILIAILLVVSLQNMPSANGCYGPHITADIDKNQVNLNDTVTVTGLVCPIEPNVSVRVDFTRPNYSYIDLYTTTNDKGEFTVTHKLDMIGYWNIFAINGHMCDRLYANVTDANNPQALGPTPGILPAYKPNYSVIAVAAVGVGIAAVAITTGARNRTRKISSTRLFVQIFLVLLIFFGVFVDHQILPNPAAQIAPHEVLVGTNLFGVSMPDGLPAPFFACFYPCGKTVTCALWQIQTYIYPFWEAGRGWGVNYDATGIARLAVVFGVIIFAAVLLGRFFCGWICPFGLYVDLMSRLRKALGIKRRNLSDRFNERFHQLAYVILAVIIIICVIFGSQAISGTQLVAGTQKGGFVYDYFSAPFCQVCPMKPLCLLAQTGVGLMKPEWITSTTSGQFYQIGYYLTSTNLIILGLVTVAAFFFRRSWCRICPLGGLIALFNRFPPFKWISGVRLDKTEEKCTKCGICKRVCPTQVKEVYEAKKGDVATSQCIFCLRCVEMCPEGDCLKFKFAGKTVCKSRNWLNTSDSAKGVD